MTSVQQTKTQKIVANVCAWAQHYDVTLSVTNRLSLTGVANVDRQIGNWLFNTQSTAEVTDIRAR